MAVRSIRWLAAGVVYWSLVGASLAQNYVSVATSSGCSFFLNPFVAADLKRTQHYKGECMNGLAQGQGYALLDFGSDQVLVLSHWERGLRTGASVSLYRRQAGRLSFADYRQGAQGHAVVRDQGWNASQINEAVREMFIRIGAQVSLSETLVIETALRWNKLPRQTTLAEIFAQLDISTDAAHREASNSDDPKTTGRSARGG
jgi:hypothetical protein